MAASAAAMRKEDTHYIVIYSFMSALAETETDLL